MRGLVRMGRAVLTAAAFGAFVWTAAAQNQQNQTPPAQTYQQPAQPPATAGSTITETVNGYAFEMVYVAGGTFTMGCAGEQGSDCWNYEKPAHSVTLSGYYIGKFEATQGLWKAVTGGNPSKNKGNDNLPVEQVSWNDVQTFINTLNGKTGKRYRLPTEAEWEYAARGGGKSGGYKYSGGNNIDDVAWYKDNSGKSTHPAGAKSPNELGIYDMSGNVYEWASDWFGGYSSTAQTNPAGPASGSNRVIRGGGWFLDARRCRVSYRYYNHPDGSYNDLGFRLALPSP